MIVDRARLAAALPNYQLGDQLGAGAFGLVLAGRHRRLLRNVAVKVVAAGGQDRAAAGFAAEARILAALDHPHIVRIYDYLETDELRLIVMEQLAGGSLARRRTGMSPETVCAAGLAVAAALSYAHSRGVLHRDIKPDNVMFDSEGLLKVVDFGIAKLVAGPAATASGVVGTPMFMAPEQLSGGRLGPATDLYALGVVLYLLLAGVTPFDPSVPVHLRWQNLRRPPPPAGVPAPLANVIMRSLAEDPAARPQSAHAFAKDLAREAGDAYGPGWIARSGIVLRLDDDVRAAAEQPAVSAALVLPAAPAAPSTDIRSRASAPPASDDLAALPSAPAVTVSGNAAQPGSRPIAPPRPRRRRGRRRRQPRRLIPVALAVLLLAVVGAVLGSLARPGKSDTAIANPLGTPLSGHTDWVMSVAFSSDGRTLASGSKDSTVQLWDVTIPIAPRPLGERLSGQTTSVAFSPDGRILAGGSWDNTVKLWDVTDRSAARPLGRPLTGHSDHLRSVAFSPNGHVLASGSDDGTVRLWDLTDPAAGHALGSPLVGHSDDVQSVAFSPDGRTVASGGADGTVRLWDVTDPSSPDALGQPVGGYTDVVRSLAFSPDGRTLASGSWDHTVRLVNVTDPTSPRLLGQGLNGHTNVVWSVAFSPDGRTVASGSFDGTVRLWDLTDLSSPRPLGQPLSGHTDWVPSVAFSPDGRTLASGSADRTVRLWSVDASDS